MCAGSAIILAATPIGAPGTFIDQAARMGAVAEHYAPDPSALTCIIGAEVPIPGGETEEPATLDVTFVARLHDIIETHRATFKARSVDAAWSRIVSVVTQPGVDFGHTSIYPFIPEKAKPLSDAILGKDGLRFEAQSTDYQPTSALASLVENHFFFLKVAPKLTFRFREAVWALAEIEAKMDLKTPSHIREIMTRRMTDAPLHWRNYYSGTEAEVARLRIYSYSDWIRRYYWADTAVKAALTQRLANMSAKALPETLVSRSCLRLEFGQIPTDANTLMKDQINKCVSRYFKAAGYVQG